MARAPTDDGLTLRCIWARAGSVFGDGEVVTGSSGESTRITYREMADRIRRLAGALRSLDVGPGDRMVSFAWNSHRHLELIYAAAAIGAAVQTINVRLRPEEIRRLVDAARPRTLFLDASLGDEAPRGAGTVVVFPDAGHAMKGALDYEQLIAAALPLDDLPALEEDSVATICTTSGTTGAPRLVEYTQRSLVLGTLGLNQPDVAGIRESDTVLPVVSLFHANAWGLPFAATFAGARLILCGAAPTPATTARLVREEHVTKIAAVPTVLLRLLEEPDLDLTSVEEVFVSGAAPPATLVDALENRYGARVVHAWGMTETGFFGLVSRPHPAAPFAPDSIRDLRLSQGRPAPLVDARINGNEGELEVRGPGVAGRAADVALDGGRVTRDGWLRTGDLATYWPFPYLKVVDRLHDTFKSGGEWIHTLELEEHLVAFPGVREAAVVAVPDERWGARPYAFVGVATRGDVNWEDVVAFLATRVPRWWVPDTFEILDRLPRTATGKIDKRALRATLATRPAPEGSRSGSGHVEHVPS